MFGGLAGGSTTALFSIPVRRMRPAAELRSAAGRHGDVNKVRSCGKNVSRGFRPGREAPKCRGHSRWGRQTPRIRGGLLGGSRG